MKRLIAILAFALAGCVTPTPPTSAVIAEASLAVVSLEFKQNRFGADFPAGPRSFCSGVVISADRIITNRHCAEGDPRADVWVRFKDGNLVRAYLIGVSELPVDAAVYSVDPRFVLSIAEVRTTPVLVGESVFAVGMPVGLRWTVTAGIVSAVDRMIGDLLPPEEAVTIAAGPWIQTDAPINPGNSGGALFDAQGRLVGINTLSLTGGRVSGVAMAWPIVAFLESISKFL